MIILFRAVTCLSATQVKGSLLHEECNSKLLQLVTWRFEDYSHIRENWHNLSAMVSLYHLAVQRETMQNTSVYVCLTQVPTLQF